METPQDAAAEAPRRPVKSEAAFRTISEVSEELDVPQHVLRFWESKFPQIKPLKRGGGRRYYRPEDVGLLLRIRDLLYKDGYTIRGVQKLLKEQSGRGGAREAAAPAQMEAPLMVATAGPTLTMPVTNLTSVTPRPAPATSTPAVTVPAGLGSEEKAELEAMLSELQALRELLAQARSSAGR